MSDTFVESLSKMEEELEELKKAMDDEYETNKESALYWELHKRFCELEAAHEATKKEEEKFWDEYNNRPKRCIHCGALKGEVGDGPCPLARPSIPNKN